MNQSANPEFQTTHWSIVVSATRGSQIDSQLRRQSLGELCAKYWMPLFVYLRRKGIGADDAADYVQGFLAALIEKDFVSKADQARGRFRWFLMSAINRFISKQVARDQTEKRGGRARVVSIDVQRAEDNYRNEPVDGWTPEKLFDRRWAVTVLQEALENLESDYQQREELPLFQKLRPMLTLSSDSVDTYRLIADELGMTEAAVKVAATRLRQRYRQWLSRIVLQTLADPDALDDEMQILLAALRGENA